MGTDTYLLENSSPDAGRRFDALSALFDEVTLRHVDRLGPQPGWRCWEVGAGGPGLPRALADRVGPDGHVLATDLDVEWMGAQLPATVRVRRHDVAVDEVPGAGFDLVHARLVLTHVPARAEALRRMVAALRPGGWLLVEDFDVELQPLACVDAGGDLEQLANRVRAGFVELLAERGVDMTYGRALPRLLRAAGLDGVAADAFAPVALPASAALETANVRQVGPALVARGRVDAPEIGVLLRALAAGRVDIATPPLVSAWGRRPPGPTRP